MEPWVSWVLFGTGISIAGGYYYTQSQKKIARAREVAGRRRGSQARLDSKDKRAKGRESGSSDHVASDSADLPSAAGSGAESVKKRKGNKKQPSKLAQSSSVGVSNENKRDLNEEVDEDEGMTNADFARQFSSKQAGTDLKKSAGPAEKQRSQKPSKHNKATSEFTNGGVLTPSGTPYLQQQPSTASSTTGADADDDSSPANSPELGATPATVASGMDVSDMLDASAKGPSVLNITAPANPPPARQPKQQKLVQEPETKKQRQNRRKKDEQRVAREEDEKQRRILLERQLRTAREAEGRPAKNGLGISNAPTSNAWSKTTSANGDVNAYTSVVSDTEVPFLDTFDEGQSSGNGTASLNAVAVNGVSSPQAPSSSTFIPNNDLPSEEEQLRLITEMDSNNTWNTVNKGGKTKKTKASEASTNVSKSSGSTNHTLHGQENRRPPSKFAALDVEHPTEEATNLDKVEDEVTLTQSATGASAAYFDDNGHKGIAEAELQHSVDRIVANDHGEIYDATTRNDSNATAHARKSITGLEIPDHVHPGPHEMWITKDTPADALPEGWYHYNNGCRYGNAKIPQRDREYERELYKHAQSIPDGHQYSHDHHKRAKLERDNYYECHLIYRAHIARTIDLSKWNKDNIKQHPAYEHDWPYALLQHPSEGWSAGFHDESRSCNLCEAYSR